MVQSNRLIGRNVKFYHLAMMTSTLTSEAPHACAALFLGSPYVPVRASDESKSHVRYDGQSRNFVKRSPAVHRPSPHETPLAEQLRGQSIGHPPLELVNTPTRVLDELAVHAGGRQRAVERLRLLQWHPQDALQ